MSQKLRVLIIRRVPGSTFSMDIYADNLVAGLRTVRPDWDIQEIAPVPWNSPDKLWQSGVGLKKYYERFWHHPNAVSQKTADIFHIIDHTNAHVAYWLRKTNQKTVVTCHDLVQFVYPQILKNQSRLPGISMGVWKYSVAGMKLADRVVAVSTNTANDIWQFLGIDSSKTTVIPNGVESCFQVLEPNKYRSIQQHYQGDNKWCLLNVGTTHQRKNIETVLKVTAALKNAGCPVVLWRVGAELTPQQNELVQTLGIEDVVVKFDKPDLQTLIKIYNAADILLAPSLYEGFGLTVLEAMSCGTPVITSNISALPEVVDDAAIVCDPLDIDTMTKEISKLMSDRDYYLSFQQKGLSRAKIFSWQSSASMVANLYEELATVSSS